MALQLIYTSAPRLLQAGRTGFGTVAAHPGIPAWMVGEIERASQFSRVPGLDSARVVIRHMIFGQGDRVHHVLSRIQDAGADYTGRTNHIAHHFVFTAAEAAKATVLSVTPVDALAFLESHKLWQTSWDGEPRPLSDDAILPVESIPKTITLPAETYWGALVPGRPECAAILAPGKTSEACWIVYPHGWRDAIVYAMGESLALHSNPWGVSFANDLQPTDNEQQIAWRGIPADSPLLQKAQSSVRPCIDLTNPDALAFQPMPEFAEEARTGKKPQPKSRAAAPLAAKSQTNSEETPAPAIALLSKTNEGPRRNPYALPLAVMLGVLILLLGVGGVIWGYDVYSKNKSISEEMAGLKSEILAQVSGKDNAPDLSKFERTDELAALLQFLKAISEEDTDRAKESLDKLGGFSSEWNEWRSFCNKLLDSKKEEMEKKTLADLYAKALHGDALTDDQWNQFQMLVQNLHPKDEKWDNALKALNFLRNPSSDGVSHWMQKREFPGDDSLSAHLLGRVRQEITKIKIMDYNERIAEISDKYKFQQELESLLANWSEESEERKCLAEFSKSPLIAQTENLKKFNLSEPAFLNLSHSKNDKDKFENPSIYKDFNALPPIYLIVGNSKKLEFAPTTSSSSSQKPDKWHIPNSFPINWGEFSSITIDSWEDKSATLFKSAHLNAHAYYVTDQNSSPKPRIKFFVIEKDKIAKIILDFTAICEVAVSSIKLKKDFIIFLDSIYKAKEVKFTTFLELIYKSNKFQKNNLHKQKIKKTKPIALGDLNQTIIDEKSMLDNKLFEASNQKIDLEEKLKTKKSEIENFRFKPSAMNPWEDFRKQVQNTINDHPEKNKLKSFIEIFNRTESHKKVEGFLEKYSEITNKENFTSALSNLPEEQRKWFFFDGKEWLKESQDKFLNQFNKQKYDTIKNEINVLSKKIKEKNDAKVNLEREMANLEQLKTDQKATLNFYLEEADKEPFLTTEVTIPFSSERPADANTPSHQSAP